MSTVRVDPERRRSRRRLILVLASLPVVIGLVVVSVYLFSLPIRAQAAIDAHARGDYSQSEDISTGMLDVNILETWIPYFNRGDALVGDEDYTAAVDDFETALELAPFDRKCMVRVNLARTWEALGDVYEAGGYHEGAALLYQAAKDVIAAATEGECPPGSDEKQELDETSESLARKQQEAQQNGQDEGGDDPTGTDDKLDDLGEKQQQSDQEKSNEQAQQNGEDSEGGIVEKPW